MPWQEVGLRINQRINFYIDDFRPPVIPLPANKMAGMLVALMVGMVGRRVVGVRGRCSA